MLCLILLYLFYFVGLQDRVHEDVTATLQVSISKSNQNHNGAARHPEPNRIPTSTSLSPHQVLGQHYHFGPIWKLSSDVTSSSTTRVPICQVRGSPVRPHSSPSKWPEEQHVSGTWTATCAVLLPIMSQNLLSGQLPARLLPITCTVHCARCKAMPFAIRGIASITCRQQHTGRPEFPAILDPLSHHIPFMNAGIFCRKDYR